MIARWLAFSLFAMAAFAWTLPGLDRAGMAALAFAFLALSVGRGAGRSPAHDVRSDPAAGADAFELEPVEYDADDEPAQVYTHEGWR